MSSLLARLALALVACSATLPSLVAAQDIENAFVDGRVELSDDDLTLVLSARAPVAYPDVRTDPGFVRVRFPEMPGWTHLDVEGDGRSIRFARVRPGASDSGVLVIRLADSREIPESAVHVRVSGREARVAIARAALPIVAEPVATAPVADDALVEEVSAHEAEHALVADVTGDAIATDERTSESLGAAEPAGRRAEDASDTERAAVLGTAETHASSIPVLLLVTGLLALVYLAIRALQKRLGGTKGRAPIRVLATHALGGKQQLVIVRALGQDHFLAIDGGRTDRILSVPADEQEPEAASEAIPSLGWLAALRSAPAATDSRADAAASAPSAPVGAEASTRFGAQLLKLATDRAQAAQAAPASAPPPAAPRTDASEAVAGIVRLRARAGR